ncbi:DUF3616 domain-containing protein [Rhizobium sp. 16-449-1b]|uniref:DUF3616 domain-containing protein n=1 Tax=Rhizobium sp. 16-449-1b TaxID=2819989 RepID=UPI001ADD1CDB|nr:DUF3616 domain-containing protein [Rhizobium sp. 16-449-1b]MBO9198165.1 DUF3616 domain-containing protein [Rhizobium sp. 16-449-1b]
MNRRAIFLRGLVIGAAWLVAACCHAEIKVVAGPLSATGNFHLDDKTRRSISGVSCPAVVDGSRVCLVAFDEDAEARTIEISDSKYKAHKKSVQLGPSNIEMDSEGVAADDKYYYVTGSHANKRKHCEDNQGSHRLVRIAYDQKTGLPLRKSGELQDINDQYDIEDALPDNLRNSVGKCLGSVGDGFDIEGLAAYNGKLYVGLRGPTLRNPASEFGALAYIVETSVLPADAGRSRKEPFMVAVPRGAAIRDMASVRGGILLLLGPDDDNHEVNWSISLWRVDDHVDRKYPVATVDLGVLDLSKALRGDCDETVKPEGMAVLAEGAEGDVERYHLAIFSDGMCDGGPVIVDATRSQ